MTEYPPLSFSTGYDVDGIDMAEWVSHAHFDLFKTAIGMELAGWGEEAEDARRIAHDILVLLSRLKDRSEEGEQ